MIANSCWIFVTRLFLLPLGVSMLRIAVDDGVYLFACIYNEYSRRYSYALRMFLLYLSCVQYRSFNG